MSLLCPSKDNYKYNIATCYEALGDVENAIKILEQMVYVNPKFTMPAQKLASLYIKTNQLNKAKEIYDNILLKNKVTADIMHQYAILSSSLSLVKYLILVFSIGTTLSSLLRDHAN